MGGSTWDSNAWAGYSQKTQDTPAKQIFKGTSIHADLDPHNFSIRESCDSAANPNSTAVMVFADVTGSMGVLADNLIKHGLGVLFQQIRDRRPIPDPHILVGAIGDVACDDAPVQASQFEADLKIAEQLEKVYIECGGGANYQESYILAHYIAAYRTRIDCWLKRAKKGYLFTIGDEPPSHGITRDEIKSATGDIVEGDMTFAELIDVTRRTWHSYHIIISEGSHVRYRGLEAVHRPWVNLLGEHVVVLKDINALAETIVSIIQVNEGANIDDVAKSWGSGTDIVVRDALNGLTKYGSRVPGTGVATL